MCTTFSEHSVAKTIFELTIFHSVSRWHTPMAKTRLVVFSRKPAAGDQPVQALMSPSNEFAENTSGDLIQRPSFQELDEPTTAELAERLAKAA